MREILKTWCTRSPMVVTPSVISWSLRSRVMGPDPAL